MIKPLDQYFTDWYSHVLPYGYGTGEVAIMPCLTKLMALVPDGKSYDYRVLEEAVTAPVAWLLLGALHNANIFDYGTSTRYAWLTAQGKRLKAYLATHSDDELIEIACEIPYVDDYSYSCCYPDACNCGPRGHQEGVTCANPFWLDDKRLEVARAQHPA